MEQEQESRDDLDGVMILLGKLSSISPPPRQSTPHIPTIFLRGRLLGRMAIVKFQILYSVSL